MSVDRCANQKSVIPKPENMVNKQNFIEYNTALFRRVAPFYDVLGAPIAGVRQAFVAFVAPPPGARVLDVATGTGKQAMAFAAHGCETTGTDLSPHMLTVARRKNRHPAAHFELADGSRLPFADRSFDVVCMSFALHCMPLPVRVRVVREMVRVARDDGRIAFVDYGLPPHQPMRWLAYHAISLYETPLWQAFIRSDLEALLMRRGLRIADVRALWGGTFRMFSCIKVRQSRSQS